jgi:ATP synthase F1 delta subunit
MIFTAKTKLYGKAFLNHFYKKNPLNLPYEKYQIWLKDLPDQKKQFLILSLASVPAALKTTVIDQLLEPYNLENAEKKLLSLLYSKKELTLLPHIIAYLCHLYQEASNQQEWIITSAKALTAQEKKALISTITNKTNAHILPTFLVNASLYAGFTMQHHSFFWDRSLRSFLKKVTHFIHNHQ